jgi:hypothetical protein
MRRAENNRRQLFFRAQQRIGGRQFGKYGGAFAGGHVDLKVFLALRE